MKEFLFLFFLSSFIFAQTNFPKDYFKSPLAIPMRLSGNFGELRPNHFHAGLDFKTMQEEGLGVYASADGYVSRIKISTFGNGKTIYITHPNGYTTVYAHLKTAEGAIQKYIIKTHYREQSFEIEMFLKPGELPVRQGELIAYSGNTGASEGPHLHFEIRNSKTEHVINPFLFGFDSEIEDTNPPKISGLYVYYLDSKPVDDKSDNPVLVPLHLLKGGGYLADKVEATGDIGFGIIADDYDDVSLSKNGVYKVESFVNGRPNFEYHFDTYSFDDMRFINNLIDYKRYKKTNQKIQKLFLKNKYASPIIATDDCKGIVEPIPDQDMIYRIEVSDFVGNKTEISVPIKYGLGIKKGLKSPKSIPEESKTRYFVKYNKENSFEKDNMAVFFPSGTFYSNFYLDFDVKENALFLHEDTVPAHTNFTISITDTSFKNIEREKVFIARMEDDKIVYNSTYNKNALFTTRVKTLGKYKLISDVVPPQISMPNPIEDKIITAETIEIEISDVLSGIKSYSGYLNGKWILFEYDNKTKKINHNLSDGLVVEGLNNLKVVVIDNVDNYTIFETRFFFVPKDK